MTYYNLFVVISLFASLFAIIFAVSRGFIRNSALTRIKLLGFVAYTVGVMLLVLPAEGFWLKTGIWFAVSGGYALLELLCMSLLKRSIRKGYYAAFHPIPLDGPTMNPDNILPSLNSDRRIEF